MKWFVYLGAPLRCRESGNNSMPARTPAQMLFGENPGAIGVEARFVSRISGTPVGLVNDGRRAKHKRVLSSAFVLVRHSADSEIEGHCTAAVEIAVRAPGSVGTLAGENAKD